MGSSRMAPACSRCRTEADARSGLERHLVGVDRMVRAIEHSALDVNHGIPPQEALCHGLLEHPCPQQGIKPPGNGAALDLVGELIALAWVGADAQPAVTELACAAGFASYDAPCASAVFVMVSRYGCAQGTRRASTFACSFMRAMQRFHLSFAHCRNDGLVRLLVTRNAQRGVVLNRTRKEGADLVLFLLISRFDGDGDCGTGSGSGSMDIVPDCDSVSPARVSVSLGTTMMSPAFADFTSVASLPIITYRWPQAILFARARVDQLHTGREHAADQLQVSSNVPQTGRQRS